KLITESIDPNAKVIFGTVRDTNLKKGEVKVTVIASGFPENNTRKIFTTDSKDDKRGKIFNTLDISGITVKGAEEKKPATEEKDEDDWGAVPAFLRRSKTK
ncbi:cell division protein FtsZ, partial [Candidatus Nomurabacteria bacterium]|nr:cell division protein FtsZ [Candidatus Nomurabacteria bacterium]